jgi:DNA-binding transcriptional LysR family regulator
LTYQPTFLVADELKARRLVALQLDYPPVELGGVFALYPSERRPPAKVRAFIDFLADRFEPVPPWDLKLAT